MKKSRGKTVFTSSQKKILLALSLAVFVIVIDGTIMNVSMRAITKDLGISIAKMQTLITMYSLVMAMFILIGAKISDIVGRKKIFIVGATIFGTGALIATFSKTYTELLIGWSFVEGLGAALMMPATLSLMTNNFEKKARAIAFGVWGGTASSASALGPIIGGYLTDHYTWRYAFAIEILVVALILYFSRQIKDRNANKRQSGSLDIVGSIISSLSLGSVIYGLLKVNTYGWIHSKQAVKLGNITIGDRISPSLILVVVGLTLLILFILWERFWENKGNLPLISLSLFKNKQFVAGITLSMIINLAQAGIFFTIPIFLQLYLKYSATQTGVALLPLSIAVFFASVLGSRSSKPPKKMIQAGLLISLISIGVLYISISPTTTILELTPGLLLTGLGMGLVMSQITNITLSSVDTRKTGEASGINSTLRRLGSSLGTAIIGSVLFTSMTTSLVASVENGKTIPPVVKDKVITQLESSDSYFTEGLDDNTSSNTIRIPGMQDAVDKAVVDSVKHTLIITSWLFGISILTTTLLPNNIVLTNKRKRNIRE